jgi:hypothetical protein
MVSGLFFKAPWNSIRVPEGLERNRALAPSQFQGRIANLSGMTGETFSPVN